MVALTNCGCCGCPNNFVTNFYEDFSPSFDTYWSANVTGPLTTSRGRCQIQNSSPFTAGRVFGLFKKPTLDGGFIKTKVKLANWNPTPYLNRQQWANMGIFFSDAIGNVVTSIFIEASYFSFFNGSTTVNQNEWHFFIGPNLVWTSAGTSTAGPKTNDVFEIKLSNIENITTGIGWQGKKTIISAKKVEFILNGSVIHTRTMPPFNVPVFIDACEVKANIGILEKPDSTMGKISLDDYYYEAQ
jgi:hypothetical protein